MGSFNAETRGKAVLIYSGLTISLIETGDNGKLQRRQIGCSDRISAHRHAYLVEASRQRGCNPTHWRDAWTKINHDGLTGAGRATVG
jgi:hypothetical protein